MMDNQSSGSTDKFSLVGIGASAGGLEALEVFFKNLPEVTNISFVIVQHLSPDFKSFMTELLSRYTSMKINKIEDGMEIQPGEVYLIPPRKNITVFKNRLYVEEIPSGKTLNLPIDIFFQSLAEEYGSKAIGIVLSGTGSDGTLGIRAIKEAGGMVMVQNEQTAKFDGMPKSSISTGLVDYILPIDEIPDELVHYVNYSFGKVQSIIKRANLPEVESTFLKIIKLLKESSGVDFSYYKESTVYRRLEKRLSINRFHNIEQYYRYLRESEQEQDILYKDLLIGVTRFFRDSDAFTYLASTLLPEIIEKLPDGSDLRIWSVGCSTGEEAFSLAMIVNEYVEQTGKKIKIKIFATDIDQESIEVAGTGYYQESIVSTIDTHYLKKFFIKKDEGYQIQDSIRKQVIFATHNVLKDPPFSRIHLLVCRNLFIYLKPDVQSRILTMFYFALQPNGYLFLGNSESLGNMESAFSVLNRTWKIYKTVPDYKPEIAQPFIFSNKDLATDRSRGKTKQNANDKFSEGDQLLLRLVHELLPPTAIVKSNFDVLHLVNDVNEFLKFPKGVYTSNLLKLAPEELSLVLSTIGRGMKTGRNKISHQYDKKSSNGTASFRIEASILDNSPGQEIYAYSFIKLTDVNKEDGKTEMVEHASISERNTELERELLFTKENLRATVEELETSNEELQSSNEELIASNEELQSTNEELQSVNEELYTVNSEHQNKIEELTQLNNDINNLLNNTRIGTLFLDKNLNIRKITPVISEITNIIEVDINRPIHHISVEGIYPEFIPDIENVLKTLQPVQHEIRLKNEEWYLMKILPYRTENNAIEGILVTFVNIDNLRRVKAENNRQSALFKRVLDNSPVAKIVVDREGNITYLNSKGFEMLEGTLKQESNIFGNMEDITFLTDEKKHLDLYEYPHNRVILSGKPISEEKYLLINEQNEKINISINGEPIFNESDQVDGVILSLNYS